MKKMNRTVLGLLALPWMLAGETLTPEKREFFENRIRPVLAQQCFICHTNSKMAGLRLDSREDILKGGKSGPAIVPGEPEKSLLISAVRQTTELKMPKGAGHITDAQVADLATWVKDGAYWPTDITKKAGLKGYVISAGQRQFWSFQPLAHPPAAQVKEASPRTT